MQRGESHPFWFLLVVHHVLHAARRFSPVFVAVGGTYPPDAVKRVSPDFVAVEGTYLPDVVKRVSPDFVAVGGTSRARCSEERIPRFCRIWW